ncbi:MAG: serine/threonine-protein kinase [Candidatus Bathyarchaeia archaeon]
MVPLLEGFRFPNSHAPERKRFLVPGLPFFPADLGNFEPTVHLTRVWSEGSRVYCRLRPPHFTTFLQYVPYLTPVDYERLSSFRPDLEIVWMGEVAGRTWLLLECEPTNADSGEYIQYLVRFDLPTEISVVSATTLTSLEPDLRAATAARSETSGESYRKRLGLIPSRNSRDYYNECLRERGINAQLRIKTDKVPPDTPVTISRYERTADNRLVLQLVSPTTSETTEYFRVEEAIETDAAYLLLYPYDRTEQLDVTPPNYLVRLKNRSVYVVDKEEFQHTGSALIDLLEAPVAGRRYRPTGRISPAVLDRVVELIEPKPAQLVLTPAGKFSCSAPQGLTNIVPIRKSTTDDETTIGPALKLVEPGRRLLVNAARYSPEGPLMTLMEPNQTVLSAPEKDASALFVESIFEHRGSNYIALYLQPSLADPASPPHFILKLYPDGTLETISNRELMDVADGYKANTPVPKERLLADLNRFFATEFSEAPDPPSLKTEVDKPNTEKLSQLYFGEDNMLGNYRICQLLVKGRSSSIYEAEQMDFAARRVAVKVLHTGQNRTLFKLETGLTASMSHPRIVRIFQMRETKEQIFCSMPLLEGMLLGDWIERSGAVHLQNCIDLVTQIASALDYAHLRGAVHSQVHPWKIYIDEEWNATLFGFKLTSVDRGYISPEQMAGSKPDARSDNYSLALTTWHALAGRPPHDTNNTMDHILNPLPKLSEVNPKLPASLDEVLARGAAKDPAERYSSATEFASALKEAIA